MRHFPMPVIMYHSVGIIDKKWIWNHLTCPWQLFDSHLYWLSKEKFHTIFLEELYNYKRTGKISNLKSIVLTFDDGYLDNWVFAYPLLKKYGFKGVIFVNPDFVDPRDNVRKNLNDVWEGKASISELETKGFLSWKEIELMEKEGIMDVQSHSMTHTWYFYSDKIIDFHYPGNSKYPWMFWNEIKERKYYYLNEDQRKSISYGVPVYEHSRSLGGKRYFEDKTLTKALLEYTKKEGESLFQALNWRDKLFNEVELYRKHNKINGRYEADKEQKERFIYELGESKNILEQRLGKKIKFLCWPGGDKTDMAVRLARGIGYLAYTCSAYKEGGRNIFLEDSSKIYRISAPSIQLNMKTYYLGGLGLILSIFSFRGSFLARTINKIIKLFIIISVRLGFKNE